MLVTVFNVRLVLCLGGVGGGSRSWNEGSRRSGGGSDRSGGGGS